jgi:uracil-DNA glycosylase
MEDIHETWKPIFDQYQFCLDSLEEEGTTYPPKDQIFRVFTMPVHDIKILLLGQDPYHNPKQAHGLSFSVPDDISPPPSLKNIFKELQLEFPERKYSFKSGNLLSWFEKEKIFLLNSSLTVKHNKAGSHMSMWQEFTDDVIKYISEKNPNCVYILLGKFAKDKAKFIKNKKNIVTGIHPSPLSARQGFFNSGIFKNVETILGHPVNWQN